MTDTTAPDKLDGLAALTQEADAANPTPEQQQAAAAEQAQASEAEQAAQQWGMVMFTLGGFAQMLAPELKPVYTEERCYAWGQQANAVAKKYGWNGPGNMPELALIASTAGFLAPTVMVIRQKIQQAKTARDGSLAEKIGIWWAARRARRAAAAEPAPAGQEGRGDGRQQ